MADYQKYINALRKCAKERESDITFTGHIIVSDICRDTSNLLEELEQESCEDCISRQAALDCITVTKLKKFDFILYAREEIKKLPSVTPQPKVGRWIPVSEKLPEYGEDVLTCNGGFIEIQSLESRNYWADQNGEWSDIDEVVAWMPLPEPYRVESEE